MPTAGVTLLNPSTQTRILSLLPGKDTTGASTLGALESPPIPPMALIAAEHTAQVNNAQSDEVFSKAEEHEILFQDVNLGPGGHGA